MAERTKEHYEKSFEHAREQVTTFASNIAMGNYDHIKSPEQISALKETINEQRAEMAQDNEKYQEQFNCPEYTAYNIFVEKSRDVLKELFLIQIKQVDTKLEDTLGENQNDI